MAPVLLPHLEHRPLTLKRYPNGVEGKFFYEKQAPSHRPDWVPVDAGAPQGREDHQLRPGPRRGDAGLAGQPRRPRAAHADAPRQTPTRGLERADDDRLRPRPRRAGRRCSSAAGRARAAGHVRAPGAAGVREDLGLQGHAGLRAAQRPGRHLRADQGLRQGGGRAAGGRGRRPGGLAPGQAPAAGQGARRLEPERRQQDDRLRVLAARARAADGLDAADLGRGARGAGARGTRRRWCSRWTTCWRACASRATCSPTS